MTDNKVIYVSKYFDSGALLGSNLERPTIDPEHNIRADVVVCSTIFSLETRRPSSAPIDVFGNSARAHVSDTADFVSKPGNRQR